MKKINYFDNEKECEDFLNQFNFKYYIDELINENERYYIELNDDMNSIRYCAVEKIINGMIYYQKCFYDSEEEYIFKNGIKVRRYMLKDEGEMFRIESAKACWYEALEDVYTIQEACKMWNKDEGNLRRLLINKDERLTEEVDYKKMGKVWLITKEAMEKLYGKTDN